MNQFLVATNKRVGIRVLMKQLNNPSIPNMGSFFILGVGKEELLEMLLLSFCIFVDQK